MDDPSQNDELYPIAVLIDELKHDDVLLRLNAIRRLSTIALALGPERTREELIPFLDESVEDEDEVLTALSDELGNFVEYVGGPEYGHVLLSPLENLAGIEEPLVRDKAVESLNKICAQLSQSQIEQYFLPLVARLSKADWFTSKISATALYTVPYGKLSSPESGSLEGLRSQFAQLVRDETPMVRRQAATNLAKFVKEMSAPVVTGEMLPLFQHLASDDQDSVRLLTVDVLISICTVLGSEVEDRGMLVTSLRGLFEDKSWRVRYMVAERFVQIAQAMGGDKGDGASEVVERDMVPAFVRLLKDGEAEVRGAAAGGVPGFCQMVDQTTLLNTLLPAIEDLVTDTSQHVRAAFASQISGLAPILGPKETTEHLLPMFLQMLKDDFPDVRLNIISKLEAVNDVIGVEVLSQSLLPAIVQLAEDKQWRVRLAIITHLPLLASQLGQQFFDEKLSSLCMSWLGDTVFSIREASTQNLRKLTEVFGETWCEREVIGEVRGLGERGNYLLRMGACFAVSTLAPALSLPVLARSVLPILASLVNDPIPNIRFNVAKSYAVLIDILKRLPYDTNPDATIVSLEAAQKPKDESAIGSAGGFPAGEKSSLPMVGSKKGDEIIREEILPPLEKLSEDEDVDVRFFASVARRAWMGEDGKEGEDMET